MASEQAACAESPTFKCPERQVYEFVDEYLSNKKYISSIEIGTLHTLMTKHVDKLPDIDGIGLNNNDIDLDGIDPIFPWRARGYPKFYDFVTSIPGLKFSRTKNNNHSVCIDHSVTNIEPFFIELEKVPIKIKSMQQRKEKRLHRKKWRHKKQAISFQEGYNVLSKLSCLPSLARPNNDSTECKQTQEEEENNQQIVQLRNSFYSKISSAAADADENKDKDYNVDTLDNIDWNQVPDDLCPEKVILSARNKEKRGTWKKRQIETFYEMLKYLLMDTESDKVRTKIVVDFGCGSGNIGLALASLFPTHQFILIDYNPYCVKLATERMNNNKLSNVKILQCKIEEFDDVFDIGIACHACGNATDYAQIKCFQCNAHFILCSCCVGKIEDGPRSKRFQQEISLEEYKSLARIADHNETDFNHDNIHGEKRKLCKTVLELDRIYAAKETKQYDVVLLTQIIPYNDGHSTSPKNDVIIGIHRACNEKIKSGIKRLFDLPNVNHNK